jgi:GTPase Era involved in 16S rRNA processing
MIELGKDIYSNFNKSEIGKEVQKKVRAVVLGCCGSGKTSLFNNLCKKDYPTGSSNDSKTREIDFEDVAYFEKSEFRMYDTPGTNSVGESLHHAMLLRTSLNSLEINLIMVAVKVDNRFSKTFNELQ